MTQLVALVRGGEEKLYFDIQDVFRPHHTGLGCAVPKAKYGLERRGPARKGEQKVCKVQLKESMESDGGLWHI